MTTRDRYLAALHQVQTGVAFEIELGILDEHPKHPQVGLISAQINHDTIMALLTERGLVGSDETTTESNRFGLDMLMVQQGALSLLLVDKGIFTHEEFFDKLIMMTEREAAMHAARLTQHLGRPISLG